MNKREMAKLYTKMNPEMLSIIKAENEIEEFLETVKEVIVIDGKVKFPKIGTFEILTRKSRIVANPVTKEQMTIYPKKIIKFRASKKIK
ncbi:HU family DNA-binding protein [Fusobacterium ulcerans]|uniref:HU family DNA-binding protein n=1 Tax=Fusobacterium ulcerans TaxID=861 RepID=UPI000E4A4412|nr:HU family DNA-binding protein [Fusobacterium ulcerans]RGY66001.1 HU family DNA-binding protein [Fusobacterium ulcerans]